MNLTGCPVPVYGDTTYRGRCPDESYEQMSFFNRLRKEYPTSYGAIAVHVRNEGQVEGNQFSGMIRKKAEGMVQGCADIVIPGSPSCVIEMKRRDHKKSVWQKNQKEYLATAANAGSFTCVALGAEAAWQAFEEWRGLMTWNQPRAE